MIDLPPLNELKHLGNSEITKDEIFNWLSKHNQFFNSFETYPDSENDRVFYDCYSNLHDLYSVIEMEEETAQALEEFKNINLNDELQLLKWLVSWEHMRFNYVDLCGNTITEESITNGKGQILESLDAYFRTELIQNCIDFDITYTAKYSAMFKKYDTLTEKENEELIPWDDNFHEVKSLKFHLKKRGIGKKNFS